MGTHVGDTQRQSDCAVGRDELEHYTDHVKACSLQKEALYLRIVKIVNQLRLSSFCRLPRWMEVDKRADERRATRGTDLYNAHQEQGQA